MFLRSITHIPVQNTIFRSKTLHNVRIVRCAATGGNDNMCKEPCPPSSTTCTDRLKLNQAKLQTEDVCPIFLKSKKDKILYLSTVGLTVAGYALSVYNTLFRFF